MIYIYTVFYIFKVLTKILREIGVDIVVFVEQVMQLQRALEMS